MFSTKQNESFVGNILDMGYMLDRAKDWIVASLDPDDIWTDDQVLDWVRRNYDPEVVFSDTTLALWADREGYVKREPQP